MNKTKWATVVILLGFSAFGQAQSCTEYNYAQTPQYDDTSDATGHISGDHLFAGTATGTCAYSSSATQYCQIINVAVGTVEPTDSGTLTTSPLGYHVSQFSTSQGSQTTPNASGGNTANSVAVAAWEWCPISGCYFTVTSSPVSVPGAAVWSHTQNAGFSCLAKSDPTYLLSIALTPANTSNVAPGAMTMTATGNYSGGGTQKHNSRIAGFAQPVVSGLFGFRNTMKGQPRAGSTRVGRYKSFAAAEIALRDRRKVRFS